MAQAIVILQPLDDSVGPGLSIERAALGKGLLFRQTASGLLDDYPTLCAYIVRGEARPAFRRALDPQLAIFTG